MCATTRGIWIYSKRNILVHFSCETNLLYENLNMTVHNFHIGNTSNNRKNNDGHRISNLGLSTTQNSIIKI